VVAAASGALVSFIAAGWRPTHPRIRRVLSVNLTAAAVAVILVVLMVLAFAGGAPAGTSIAPRIGFFVGSAAVIGWLGTGIAVTRGAATARDAATRVAAGGTPPTP
jgi:hypothetical protein